MPCRPDYQLLIDIRSFQVAGERRADAPRSPSRAKILDKDGQVVARQAVSAVGSKLDKPEPVAAVAAFNAAFDSDCQGA